MADNKMRIKFHSLTAAEQKEIIAEMVKTAGPRIARRLLIQLKVPPDELLPVVVDDDRLEVTKERIHQIEARALFKLMDPKRSRKVRSFSEHL